MWATIASLAAGIFEKLIAPIFEAWRQWRAERTARQLGEQTQADKDAAAGLKEAADANRARGNVGGADSDVDRLLRPPADRH